MKIISEILVILTMYNALNDYLIKPVLLDYKFYTGYITYVYRIRLNY